MYGWARCVGNARGLLLSLPKAVLSVFNHVTQRARACVCVYIVSVHEFACDSFCCCLSAAAGVISAKHNQSSDALAWQLLLDRKISTVVWEVNLSNKQTMSLAVDYPSCPCLDM